MNRLNELFEKNRSWSERISEQDPDFFPTLAGQQAPEYLWIGCSDSRVPANEIVDLLPGELFVHRNVSNLVVHSDMNCLSVLQFAVEVLKVKHIMVVGHYGCGGVRAAMDSKRHGLIDNWLSHIRDVYYTHRELVGPWEDTIEQNDRLCELNVVEQANNVCNTTIVQDAWDRGQELTVHGWVYSLTNGQLTDLDFCVSGREGDHGIPVQMEAAVSRVRGLAQK
ncbi:carbonate dehydratase [Marinobacterium mangrovicola]|uniref:Carbonic anhydrase n=1 Tax=Marinobacterium mangrovicola TaxID=1476959 RepID=A0A4R1GFY2_9GAMM|nr:carbonate dehydratase [Marinobacterium mangrovicola]TCK04779.1 carbonic anhydrase [Marinobacterium mangrovicola]